MREEPHLIDRSGIQPGLDPAHLPRYPSQPETGRADHREQPDMARTWKKPPHIFWRKLRALVLPVDTETGPSYESPSRFDYARNTPHATWIYGLTIVLALLALTCATLSSGLFNKRDDAVALALQSSEGAVTSAVPLSSLASTLPAMPVRQTPAAPSTSAPATVAPAATTTTAAAPNADLQSAAPTPAEQQAAARQARAAAARAATRQDVKTAAAADATVPPATSNPRAQYDLQVVRASMDKNNLTTARAVLSRVLAKQPNNIDAIKLNADLEDRELKRNSLLLAARSCAEQDQWHCVWRNAGNALVTDASNAEAKRLMTQAMWQSELDSRTGATPPLGLSHEPVRSTQ
ncbi:hypothetical protein [Paraburkholderia sp. DHOC27]|uniref:hypothetical protein n=1 Tax=Paraburkholderia sp. DHOC27 TaxID=2303330 RepID=UPI000E3CEF39|nr:hypothetical protein [Paraburkholderia sp. DHOC27]RFU48375.1 hypothetical protein D0B32_00560 [Paraburkholderia sp. DHOC27]